MKRAPAGSIRLDMSTRADRWRSITGIDFHIAITLLLRSWNILAGGVMVFVIPATLDPAQQGYYFTFSSLLALQIFFELGLNQVVAQIVSHEMASVAPNSADLLSGSDAHLDRIRSVVAMLRKWYAVAATLFALSTITIGLLMFERNGALPTHAWLGPWLALTLLTAANLYMSPMLAVLEGCGHVGQVARVRLAQSMIGYGLAWVALLCGAGLWAIPLVAGTTTVSTALWLRHDGHLLRTFDSAAPIPRERAVDWRREVLPYQWRIAVSWISGYLMFQLFTPLTFVNLGAVAAGRLGMSLAIFNALQSVGVSWINAKIPAMTAHVSRRESRDLDRTFFAVVSRSVCFTLAAAAGLLGAVIVAGIHGMPVVDRLADLATLCCIACVTVVNTIVYGAATFMRAHRREPMTPVSIVVAVLTLLGAYVGSKHGIFFTMLPLTIATTFVALPWTCLIFRGFRNRDAE